MATVKSKSATVPTGSRIRLKNFTKTGLHAALGLLLTTASLSAAEPVLTLAMARPDSQPLRRSQTTPSDNKPAWTSTENSAVQNTSFSLWNIGTSPSAASVSSHQLRKPAGYPARNPFKLSRREAEKNPDARLWASATVHAGYGEVFYDKPARIYGHNGTGWEEPSCGYVKLQLRF